MSWTEHAIWWQAYPLGFVGAPVHDWRGADARPDLTPRAQALAGEHRLTRVVGWLDHLVALGANGLLLGPVFASTSHGYDTLDHRHVDPRLGTDDDLDSLVAAAHARGVRVCLDGVFNHVGADHPLVVRALAEGPDGPYAGWFDVDWSATPPRPRVFEGHRGLVELDHAHPGVRDWAFEILAGWTARGVDAWRLDAAYAVDPAFWADVLPRVRAVHPDVWFLGELIHGDQAGFVAASTVDSITQYPLWKAIWSALLDRNLFELDWALARHSELLDVFVPNTFVGNHDVTRVATRVGADGAALAAAVLLTVGGVPSIYAGDELAFTGEKTDGWGGDDAIRPEFAPNPDLGPGERMFRWHQDLVGLRRRHPWLTTARTRTLELTNTRLVYAAQAGGDELVVTLDVADRPRAEVRSRSGETLTWV